MYSAMTGFSRLVSVTDALAQVQRRDIGATNGQHGYEVPVTGTLKMRMHKEALNAILIRMQHAITSICGEFGMHIPGA